MSISNLPLMKAIGAKLDYLGHRQAAIATNIANADTPNYLSRDLKPVDFGAMLNLSDSGVKPVTLTSTNPNHITDNAGNTAHTKNKDDKMVYEVSPDKNGVILEEQMVRASQVKMDYSMLINLMGKESSMYETALGTRGA